MGMEASLRENGTERDGIGGRGEGGSGGKTILWA